MSPLTRTHPRTRTRTAPRTRPVARGSWRSTVVVHLLLGLFTLYTLLPLAWLLVASTKNHRDLFGTGGFELADFNLFANLGQLFRYGDGVYGRWLGNSVLYFGLGCLAATFVSIAVGYAFDKYDFPHKEKLFGLVLVGVLVPGPVLVLPQYLLATHAGIVNTYWALLIPMLVNPFGVYLGRVFAEGYVPNETLEAARADGAGEGRIFRSVALPMLVPGFVTVFLFSFTASWNNVILPLMMLNDESLYPVTLGLAGWSESSHVHPEFYAMTITGSLVAIVPLVIAFVCLQRFWRAGLTAGAVK